LTVALSPDQYQRGSVLESDGNHYDVRGAVSAEGGGRFLVIGTLGQPQAGLVSEDVIRDNEDDRYTPLSAEDAADARRTAYEQRQGQDAPPSEPEPEPVTSGGTMPENAPAPEPGDTGGTDGTPTGDIPTAAPDQPADRTTVGTVPDAGGTPDSTAPATAGAEGADAQPADNTQSNQ
jgi:hypothetical protein